MLQTLILAFSLSADAFAASIAKGVRYRQMSLPKIAGIALGFGALEALAPLIGYLIGKQFKDAIESYDHWIAFIVLAGLGLRMIWRSFQTIEDKTMATSPTFAAVLLTALGTSVDATAVGFTLALFGNHIAITLAAIGIVTFAMTFMGLRLGSMLGPHMGNWAERAGGLGLIFIGARILQTHMTATPV